MTFIFKNRTIFWYISKWNREQKKWDRGSILYTINFAKYCKIVNKLLLLIKYLEIMLGHDWQYGLGLT